MRELRKYATPLTIGEIAHYGKVCDCPKEKRDIIRAEAEKRGLVVIFTEYTSDTFYFVDPRPAEYKKGFERIDDFFDWCEENHLIGQESVSETEARMFGHRHRHCFQIMAGEKLNVDLNWNRKTEWKGADPKAIYNYGYTYWNFYRERPHARVDMECAARLLQERLDYLHEINPREYEKKTVKVETGKFGWQDSKTPMSERIVVYYGDGKRGSLDYDIAYESATIYLDENFVRFDQINGYDYEIEGEFNVLK